MERLRRGVYSGELFVFSLLKVTVPFFLEWEMRAFNITPREKEKLMEEQREGQVWRRKESEIAAVDERKP
jgi:hypothetical protein